MKRCCSSNIKAIPTASPPTPTWKMGRRSPADGGRRLAVSQPDPTHHHRRNDPLQRDGQTFAHEGRMPPLVMDFRFDSQFGGRVVPAGQQPLLAAYTGNIGDDGTSVIRLRRVWDSWSTDYSRAARAPNRVSDPTAVSRLGRHSRRRSIRRTRRPTRRPCGASRSRSA